MGGRGQGRLWLALPWLERALEAARDAGSSPRLPSAEYLAARGEVVRGQDSWRAWLLDAIGIGARRLGEFPAGPCVRALAAEPEPASGWACARPVHLVTAIDHLRLGLANVDLPFDERDALMADVNRHLDGRGFGLQPAAIGRDWLLSCREPFDCVTVDPSEAEGSNLRELMPGGRDGATVRALMNEVQMLLHAHPVNEARAARGAPAVNSLWLWGFGSSCATVTVKWPRLCTDDAWLAGLWRTHGQPVRAVDDFQRLEEAGADGTIVAWSGSPAAGLDEAERRCFEPARQLLDSGACAGVALRSSCHVTSTGRSGRLRFWRRSRPLHEVLCG